MYLGHSPQHTRDLPGAQSGYRTSLPPISCQAGLQLPNPEGERSLDAIIFMANKCSFIQQLTKASHYDPVPKTRRMTMALPMQQPEGAQPTDNDEPQLVPETKPNKDQDSEPRELPPL